MITSITALPANQFSGLDSCITTNRQDSGRFNDRKILIIDDNSETAASLRQELSSLYKTVNIATDANDALKQLHEAEEQQVPYDGVILDLHMSSHLDKGIAGFYVLDSMQSLSRMPAVVINTSYMMAPAIGELAVQITDNSKSHYDNQIEQLQTVAKERLNIPAFALPVHFKLHGTENLVQKLNTALLLQEQLPNYKDILLSNFAHPSFRPTISATVAHECAELAHNFGRQGLELLADMEQDNCTALLECFGDPIKLQTVKESLEHLSEITYQKLSSEFPSVIADEVHALLAKVMSVKIVNFKDTLSSEQTLFKQQWQSLCECFTSDVSRRLGNIRGHLRGDIDMQQLLIDVGYSEKIDSYDGERIFSLLPDPNRKIRAIVQEFFECCTLAKKNSGSYVHVGVYYFPEEALRFRSLEDRKGFDLANCGDHFQLSATCNDNPKLITEAFSSLASYISEFQNSQLGFIKVGQGQLTIFITARDRTIDFEAEKARKATKDGNGEYTIEWDGEDYRVFSDRGEKKDCIAIGSKPENFSMRYSPMMYRWNGLTIIAQGKNGHAQAAYEILIFICHTLEQQNNTEELSKWSSRRKLNKIYQDGTRLRISASVTEKYKVEISNNSPSVLDDKNWVKKTLSAFGIKEEQIRFTRHGFGEKPIW